jgi:hypothetical protein
MSAAVLSFHLSESMECAQLSIKEETEDETKYGLHPDKGVLEEASTKVNVRQIRSRSSDSYFVLFYCKFCHFTIVLQIHEVSCQLFIKEEAEEAKHNVPGNFPSIKVEFKIWTRNGLNIGKDS